MRIKKLQALPFKLYRKAVLSSPFPFIYAFPLTSWGDLTVYGSFQQMEASGLSQESSDCIPSHLAVRSDKPGEVVLHLGVGMEQQTTAIHPPLLWQGPSCSSCSLEMFETC